MIKLKRKIREFTAFVLAMAIILSAVPVNAYASDKQIMTEEQSDLVKDLRYKMEQRQEAQEDAKSVKSAGCWTIATEKDRLPWNFFHVEVQNDIQNKSENKIQKELKITYGEKNDKGLRGKSGRADLYMKDDYADKTYLWEVKPYSYIDEPKRSLGINQLAQYIASDPREFLIGGSQISSDTTYRSYRSHTYGIHGICDLYHKI